MSDVPLAEPSPCPPPKPLTAAWLIAYGRFEGSKPRSAWEEPLSVEDCTGDDFQDTVRTAASLLRVEPETPKNDGVSSEETYIVRRAGSRFGPGLPETDFRMFEREFRFYTELSYATVWPAPAVTRSYSEEAAWMAPPSDAYGSSDTGVRANDGEPAGLFGEFIVTYPRVAAHSLPSGSSLPIGVLRNGDVLRGHAADVQGDLWLRLDDETIKRLRLSCCRAFAPLNGRRLGLGDRVLLRRNPGRPRVAPEDWRSVDVFEWVAGGCDTIDSSHVSKNLSSGVSGNDVSVATTTTIASGGECTEDAESAEVAAETTSNEQHWITLARKLRSRGLRIPRCFCSHLGSDWASYVLVLENLASPLWVRSGGEEAPSVGSDGVPQTRSCLPEQAFAAAEALARFHATFGVEGKLAGCTWLPLLPHDAGQSTWLQEKYGVCFELLRDLLVQVLPQDAFNVCDSLKSRFAEILSRVSQEPATLLHGDFRPGRLRFSAASTSPSVVAYDWRFVCRGRGSYDYASLLGFCAAPHARREMENEMLERYMWASGKFDQGVGNQALTLWRDDADSRGAVRDAFVEEVRAGLLLVFAFWVVRNAGPLEHVAENGGGAGTAALRSVAWLGAAIEDWDCASLLGVETIVKPLRRRKRRVRHASSPKAAKGSGAKGAARKSRSKTRSISPERSKTRSSSRERRKNL
eukprot:TRINITY_DN61843_c0_g1_i1.p1 TRINITY_DN61843_c0_g1~~TRINITY_DN61843_c0_g1_i1.p1  ORF type:complete len:690 (+),score=74.83 TRINITY_DN61843_c0_g1_i1:89-2158(+)